MTERISMQIKLPSVSLKRLVERMLADDDFLAHALENPLGAFREAGVNVDSRAFIPSDFGRFFAAVHRVRDFMQEKGEKPTFEAIFGQAPRIGGTTLNAEAQRGFFRDWDMREAVANRTKSFSSDTRFEFGQDRGASSAQDLCQTQEVRQQVRIEASFVGVTEQSAETNRGRSTEWNNRDALTDRRSETYSTTSFKTDGKRTLDDLMNGPLIYPEDLARISERLETVMDVIAPRD
jgi:hypothetical protein